MGAAEDIETGLPKLKRLDAVSREMGFPSAQAFQKWCERRGFTVHRIGPTKFVDLHEIVEAVRGAAPQKPSPKRKRSDSEVVDAVVADILAGKRKK